MKIVKEDDITWFEIARLFPEIDLFNRQYANVKYLGRSKQGTMGWAGRLKNCEGIFILKYEYKMVTRKIINWQ